MTEKIIVHFGSNDKAKAYKQKLLKIRPAYGITDAAYAIYNHHPCVFVTGAGLDEAAIRGLA